MAKVAKMYCIDCDQTLTKEVCWTPEQCLNAEPRQDVIDRVNSLKNVWIVVWTARTDELIPATIKWLRKHNVKYHAISNQKIPGDYYIDDRNLTIEQFIKGGE